MSDCKFAQIDVHIPKGTYITIQPYCIHRDGEYFPEPNTFKPERFIEKPAESHSAFMPFGLGPRHCVGMRFAQNELRIAIAKLLLNFRLVPNASIEV